MPQAERKIPLLARLLDTAIYTVDDRGERVCLAPLVHEHDPDLQDDDDIDGPVESGSAANPQGPPKPRTVWDRVRGAIGMLLGLGVIIGVVAGMCYLFWILCAKVAGVLRVPSIVGIPFVLGSLYMLYWISRLTTDKSGRRRRMRIELSHWLWHSSCAGCGYSLKEVEPGADGCRVCPECGAAWMIDRWLADRPNFRPPALAPSEMEQEKWPQRHHPMIQAADGSSIPFQATLDAESAWQSSYRMVPRWLRWKPATGRLGCLWGLLIALAIVGVVVVTILAKKLLVLLFIPLLLAGVAVVTSARRHAHLKSMAQIGMEFIARDACPCCGGAVRKALTIRYGERLCDSCGATWRDSNCAPRRTG